MVFMENSIKRKNDIKLAMAQNRVNVNNISRQTMVKSKSNVMLSKFMKGFVNYARRFR